MKENAQKNFIAEFDGKKQFFSTLSKQAKFQEYLLLAEARHWVDMYFSGANGNEQDAPIGAAEGVEIATPGTDKGRKRLNKTQNAGARFSAPLHDNAEIRTIAPGERCFFYCSIRSPSIGFPGGGGEDDPVSAAPLSG